jgi:ABC-type dipeptide/oligopeptide/nickel transport system permease component
MTMAPRRDVRDRRTRRGADLRWGRFVLRRLLSFAGGLAAVVVITFVMTRVLPGNPVYLLVGNQADEETVATATRSLGLDKPISTQFVVYVKQLTHGDLGTSVRTSQSVTTDLRSRWPATVELGVAAFLLALLWSLPLGILAAVRHGSWVDRGGRAISGIGLSLPDFWLGIVLVLVFYSTLHWVPAPIGRTSGTPPDSVTGFYIVDAVLSGNWSALDTSLAQLALPAATLALVIGAPLMRVTRTFMIEVLAAPYIRAVHALGVPRSRIVLRHALPNALLPVTAMMATVFGYVMGGTVLVEYVFAWPGIGKYAVDSIAASDYAPLMSVVLISAVTYLVVYLLTDIAHVLIDPRVRA